LVGFFRVSFFRRSFFRVTFLVVLPCVLFLAINAPFSSRGLSDHIAHRSLVKAAFRLRMPAV
jgi:hypothetical protein